MRRFVTVLATLMMITSCAWAAKPATNESIQGLLTQFPNPTQEYRTAPFMVWNMDVSQYQIDNMMEEFRKQGFGGVFIHPRVGLITEYLSPEWHALVKYTVQKGKEMGLDVWLYDENSYPSGFAGGHVSREMPASVENGQGLIPAKESVQVLPEDVEKYAEVVCRKSDKMVNITKQVADYKGVTGEYYLYEKSFFKKTAWFAGGSYVDLLVPGVTQKFMEITMSGYEKKLGADLKNSIRGVFTDEPEITTPGGIRWTPDLFEQFQKTYGYNLADCLPALHSEVGDWKNVRHDYYQMLLTLFVDRWAKPWSAYCDEKGLTWTGHYWEHMWPHVDWGPDNMAMAAWQQQPGVDMLFNEYREDSLYTQFGNVRAIKEVRSVANQLGKKRILSETYGGAGWDLTFRDLKRLADWQFVLGVNLVNQHISQMSLTGIRKTDYPPVFSRAASWWDDYKVMNDYNARLSAAMALGEQINDVLLIEPTTSIWMYSKAANKVGDKDKVWDIGLAFQSLVTELEHQQVEYDLGCEDIFKGHGSVSGGKFVVGKRAYSTVVIPELMENISAKTFDMLQQFVAQGGRLVAFSTPERVDGAISKAAQKFFASKNVVRVEGGLTDQVLADHFASDKIKFKTKSGGLLYHQRREYQDGQTILLVNSSQTEPSQVEFSMVGANVVRMDALQGKEYKIPYTHQSNWVTVKTTIPAAGSLLLRTSRVVPDGLETEVVPTNVVALEPMRPLKIERQRDNVLVVDFLDLEVGGKSYKDLFFFEADRLVYQHAGLPDNPWNRGMQYKTEIVDKDLSATGPFKATYRFQITSPQVEMATMKLVVERPALFTVKVNGKEVRGGHDFVVDEDFKRIGIGAHLKVGENIVEVSAPFPTAETELAAIAILGNFNVENQDDKWVIVPELEMHALASWPELGAPFYPWEVRYSKFYNVKDTKASYFVKADQWRGTVVQVWVNDAKVGVIFDAPYTLNVSPYLKAGANRVELRVVGSMENFLGPHHKNSHGRCTPWDWNNVTSPKAASAYFLTPYGLEENFQLLQNQ